MLTVTNSLITGNSAVGGRGTGVADAVVTGMAAGGGIDVEYVSTAVITGSVISGNAAIGGPAWPGPTVAPA